MPTYLPPRLGISMSAALAEARASATASETPIETIALYHPNFVDDFGAPAAAYFCNDWTALAATIEAGAPLHAGQVVTFQPVPFEFTRPDESDSGAPNTVQLTIASIARELARPVAQAIESMEPVTLIHRTYLRSDTSAPHETPPLKLTLGAVRVTSDAVSAQAGFGDMTNRSFPAVQYTRHEFAGLDP